ncbi:cell wall hydrolase [Hansschlegelia zhihuaiae]|uniref:cell wall hydrolase n=1 Tax=Hansschlegelia zhihuaiae TaxID=405005 RepID=UPI0019D49DC9|nr:cell wall hydrolase [Hansschlegelia zhihuaiae]
MDERRLTRAFAIAAAGLCAAACAQQPKVAAVSQSRSFSYTPADRECMARAMYFESHRGADEGMLAVGTVVANRVESGRYGSTVCEVVGQKRQFAAGVMSRTMEGEAAERARQAADAVLSGKRHPGVRKAMFFHTAGLRFRYPNMHYVLVAGGNAFYEKREADTQVARLENAKSRALALAYARVDPTAAAKPIVVASLSPEAAPAAAPVAPPAPVSVAAASSKVAPAQASAPEPKSAPASATVSAPPTRFEPLVASVSEKKAPPTIVAYAAEPAPAARIPAPAPRPGAVAAARAAKPQATPATKRVLTPEKLAPVLASSTPAASQPAPQQAAVAYNPVADAFAAFELR